MYTVQHLGINFVNHTSIVSIVFKTILHVYISSLHYLKPLDIAYYPTPWSIQNPLAHICYPSALNCFEIPPLNFLRTAILKKTMHSVCI